MSELTRSCEAYERELSFDSLLFAEALVDDIVARPWRELVMTGKKGHDITEKRIQEFEQQRASAVAQAEGDWVLLGRYARTSDIAYDALLAGYKPDLELLEQHPHNFLWDEALELHIEHPDVYQTVSRYGYGSKETPVEVSYSGEYIMPRQLLVDTLAHLYDTGRNYKDWGWGFPHWSEKDSAVIREAS